MVCKAVIASLCVAFCCAALVSATCRDAESQVDEDIVNNLDKFAKMTARVRYECQDLGVVSDDELIMERKPSRKVDGAVAYWVVHNTKGSENDPNYKAVYLGEQNAKGQRVLTLKQVESLLENVLTSQCRTYNAAVKGPFANAAEDQTCDYEMKWRVHLCDMLINKQHKIAKGMMDQASKEVLVE